MAMFFSRHFLHNYSSFMFNISMNETDNLQLTSAMMMTSCDDLLPFADSNVTSDDYGPKADAEFTCSLYDFLIEAVLMGVLCVFGFFGNSLSTVCLWKDKSKTATPLLLISLECADTLFLVTVLLLRVFTSIETFTHRLPIVSELTPYIGKYVYPCAMLTNMGTIYLTILVTVNRYISVCKPFDASSLCSIQQARKQVVIVWIISFLFNVPRFLEYEIVEDFDPCTKETFARSLPSWLTVNPVYQIVYANSLYFIVMFLVPLTSLVFLNTSLVIALRRTRKKRERMRAQKRSNSSSITGGCSGDGATGNGNGNNNNASNNRSEDDITLMLIVVVVVFIVSQSPALVTQILLFVLDGELTCPNSFFFYERISDLLVVANSSLNFIVYCFCSNRFRQILISLVCRNRATSAAEHTILLGRSDGGGCDGGGGRRRQALTDACRSTAVTPVRLALLRPDEKRDIKQTNYSAADAVGGKFEENVGLDPAVV